ncbi:LPS-assembly protein LptD [Aestuariicella sp. G3-2]|uniref:LPS-assembly protein LptD n=1 Tax=Pseudomaricurvus albidus TaxID=2842452 RepID=UPI001C0CEA1A|nr:LPS-assembly protein LptD [Aestuariicella albida]MBU3069066.1 LPS-assembly protein LptD [Aestuariicella albida]
MALRKSLLRQHIQRALTPSQSPWLLALGVLASQPITPIHAAESHFEWHCRADSSGQGWECQEQAAPGPAYKRPVHASRAATVAATGATVTDPKTAAAKPRHLPAAQVDWIDQEQMTEEQRAAMAPGCCGSYIEPVRTDDDAQLDPDKAPLRATADSSEWVQETTAVLTGDVNLTQGYRQVQSDKATLNQTDNTAELEGNVRIREPGLLVTGSRAEMNLDTNEANVANASYLVHEAQARGDSQSISIARDKVVTLDSGTFTRCEPESNTWYLKGSEITINPNTQQGVGKHVRLNIKGVPVFYTPYIRFPAGPDRQSGFLFPSISSSDGGGVDLAVPYYFNLAPNYDMTLTPRYISDRGEMLEAEFRHLSENFKTTVSGAYLANDEGGDDQDRQDLVDDGILTEEEAFPYRDEDRWLFNVDQVGGMRARWFSRIDYTTVSDVDYFRDMDNASLQVNSATHLRKLGELGYRSDNWLYQIRAEEFETLSTTSQKQYKQLPRINVNGNYRLGDWVVELNNEYVDFDHPEKDDRAVITGQRARLDYSLTWDKNWIWGFFKPGAAVKALGYQLDDEYLNADADDAPNFAVPQFSLDTGLFFEREGSLVGNRYLQTFEPRLFYFYSEQEDQDELINISGNRDVDFDTGDLTFSYNQLFRDSRFSGGDRIDDDNRLSVGLTSRFIDPERGIERFSASLGQIFYFEDRGITITDTLEDSLNDEDNQRSDSEFAAQMTAQLGDYWRFRSDITWDAKQNDKVNRGSASLRYQDDDFRLLNLSYRYTRQDPLSSDPDDLDGDGDLTDEIQRTIEQGDVSFSWPLFGNWSAVGRHNYDFTNSRELESLFGVEYNDCCYRVRLIARRWVDNELFDDIQSLDMEEDQGIFLEFQLKGLGSIGSKVSGILNDGIYGYEEREQNFR